VGFAASCGGKVIVDGAAADGTGGSGSTGSLNTTATTSGGGDTLTCGTQACDGTGGLSCSCKAICNGTVTVTVTCDGGKDGAQCSCFKEAVMVGSCTQPMLICEITGSCCAKFFF
jgi:hypothetical protein